MDKKNTMLLTVIAVATLLVAVVGATFAYFAISTDKGANSTTNITGTTSSVPEEVVALNGNTNIKLNLTAENMSKLNQGKYYYATTSDTATQADTSEPEKHKLDVGTVTFTGGTSGEVYECIANYNLTIEPTNIAFDATKDEAKLYFYGDEGVTLPVSFNSGTGVELSTLSPDGVQDAEVKFKITATGDTITKKLQATLQIKNATEERQTDLAGKTFTISLAADSFTCEPVSE